MSETRSINKTEEVKVEEKTVKTKSVKKSAPKSDRSVAEMKIELQKIMLDLRTGKEQNTSLVKKLKKDIARALTKQNNK